MQKKAIQTLIDWLREYHSHGIYSARALFELEPHFVFNLEEETLTVDDTVIHVPLYRDEKFRRQIKARGIGGSVTETDELLFGGYEMAESLAAQIVGFHSGKMGRGSRYHECMAALRKAAA